MAEYNIQHKWRVPEQDREGCGLLLSDRIQLYVEAVRLIAPFTEESLRPAAYDLHVGDEYYENDKKHRLTAKERFEIPANGLIYVKIAETFNLPYYIVGRYSLRVTQVYRGLLIDDGLHIDPGYSGPVHVPVHNFTDEPRVLNEGMPLWSIEFVRVPFAIAVPASIASEQDFVAYAHNGNLVGSDGKRLRVFWKRPEVLQAPPKGPEDFWREYPSERHKSSLLGLQQQISDLRTWGEGRVTRVRNWGIGSLALFVIGVLLGFLPAVYQLYIDAYREHVQIESKLKELEGQLGRLLSPGGGPGPAAASPPNVAPDRQQKSAPSSQKQSAGK